MVLSELETTPQGKSAVFSGYLHGRSAGIFGDLTHQEYRKVLDHNCPNKPKTPEESALDILQLRGYSRGYNNQNPFST